MAWNILGRKALEEITQRSVCRKWLRTLEGAPDSPRISIKYRS
jgi:hypothetical protein